ncbi:hypothetical protein ACB092_05G278600 [Castanea dentata]
MVFGKTFAALYDTVKDVGSKVIMFKSILISFKSNLDLLAPVVEEIRRLNLELNRPEEETKSLIKDMEDAENLIRTCSEIQDWNFPFQAFYAIVRFCKVHMQAQNRRDLLQILEELKTIREEKKSSIMKIHGLSCSVPGPPDFTVGLGEPLNVLKMQLLKEKQQQLVLTAPGGCGKTTVVEMLRQDEQIKCKFKDKIFFVTISKTLNLMIIVQRLFHHLRELMTQIGSIPILLILDDVWSGSEFRLDKLKLNVPNFNILVTSRTTFPGFSFTFGPAYYIIPYVRAKITLSCLYLNLSFLIVRGSGGFPLALRVNGRSLCGKPVEACSDLLERLQKSLEFSDHEVVLKECFMDLGSFHEDQRIPILAPIDMWAELYKLDEDGIDVIANLYELATRNLANLVMVRKDASEINNYYNEDYGPEGQRQRLIMGISGNSLPSWCTEQDQQPINARLLSISTGLFMFPSITHMHKHDLPEFVDKMDNLKVLIATNYGFFPTELRNFQPLMSLPNLKTIRWRSLKKISLFMCNIDQAFENCTIQASYALPNLIEINIDYCKDLVELPAVLCDVILLKKLIITNCHQLSTLPKEIGKLVNLEVLRLKSCTDLSELPESIESLKKLRLLDISDCLSIKHLPKEIGDLRNELPPSTTNLQQLKLVICDKERAKFWEPIKEILTNLEVKVAKKDIDLTWLFKP